MTTLHLYSVLISQLYYNSVHNAQLKFSFFRTHLQIHVYIDELNQIYTGQLWNMLKFKNILVIVNIHVLNNVTYVAKSIQESWWNDHKWLFMNISV